MDPNKTEWSMEVAWAHNNLGALNLARKKHESAIENHLASAGIFTQLIEQTPDSVGLRSAAANAYMGAYTGLRENIRECRIGRICLVLVSKVYSQPGIGVGGSGACT